MEWLPIHVPRPLFTAVYVVVGWSASVAFPELLRNLGNAHGIAHGSPGYDASRVPHIRAAALLPELFGLGSHQCIQVRADHGIRLDPRASTDTDTRRDLHSGFDVRAVLHQCRRVDLRAVRDESTTVDVLAVAQRLAVVVLDVDVVLSHDPLRSALRVSRLV